MEVNQVNSSFGDSKRLIEIQLNKWLGNMYVSKSMYDCGKVNLQASVYAEKPQKDIHSFIGKLSILDSDDQVITRSLSYLSITLFLDASL